MTRDSRPAAGVHARNAASGPDLDLARRGHANGFPPVPILRHDAPAFVERRGRQVPNHPGKRPHGALWTGSAYAVTAEDIAHWPSVEGIADHPGLGVACGSAAATDIDVYERRLAERIEHLDAEMLGTTPLRRVGLAPKVLRVRRAAGPPITKVSTPELWKDGLKAQVEILGQGQQFVADGIHPDTKQPYAWDKATPWNTPLAELPAVTQEQVAAFVAEAERLLRAEGYRGVAARFGRG
jgi:hypothetical protein